MRWNKAGLSQLLGQQAEDMACDYLKKQGLCLLHRNYRCRAGEIDLIMQDRDTLVFIEVKYRSQDSHGQALEYFHVHKRKKFARALKYFMHQQRLNPASIAHRIDLLAIQGRKIEWLKGV